jgi:hypothetical protein
MLQQLTASVRRFTAPGVRSRVPAAPLVGLGDGTDQAVAVAHSDIAMLRGVTNASADVNECTCPDSCERDHANE